MRVIAILKPDKSILQLDLVMDTSTYFWMVLFSVSVPVVHLLPQMNFLLQTTFWSCPCTWTLWMMQTVIWCITWMGINKVSLLLFRLWDKQFHHQFQSLQPHNYKYLKCRPTFSLILQKPRMLLKEGNSFWDEGLPYGKQIQEKNKHRIKHMEKSLYGINQVSLMEVIFGLSWLLFMSLTSNSLHLILYWYWGKRKKKIKMKLEENKQNVPEWRIFNFPMR